MRAPQRPPLSQAVRSTVREYFTMLQAELRGRHWWTAAPPDAPFGRFGIGEQIDLRFRQISAVLIVNGLPYLSRCPPSREFGEQVLRGVEAYLDNHPDVLELMERDVFRPVSRVPWVNDPESIVVPAPAGSEVPRLEAARAQSGFLAGVDFLAREQRNHSLATAGQRFVVAFEDARLRAHGREAYANAIAHVTEDDGDGPGYSVHSYGVDGSNRLIAVKTTRYGRETPFCVTAHEIEMSRRCGRGFWIYRVFGFRDRPRLYMVQGPLDPAVTLDPIEYRATPR